MLLGRKIILSIMESELKMSTFALRANSNARIKDGTFSAELIPVLHDQTALVSPTPAQHRHTPT